jgi:hypothetical protein
VISKTKNQAVISENQYTIEKSIANKKCVSLVSR